MKLVGFTYNNGTKELLLKSDSSLLVNKKPFFIPEYADRIAAHPCIVYRVCKLGKNISPRFANRYIDSYAAGLHIEAINILEDAQNNKHAWTTAVAFDGTLPVGTFLPIKENPDIQFNLANQVRTFESGIGIEQAIAEISAYMTIRQGDLIFLCANEQPFFPLEDQHIEATIDGEDNLFCKIK